MRCLTLAEAMIDAGWNCRFAIGPETLKAVHRLTEYEAECIHLSEDLWSEPEQMASGLDHVTCDVLVVDHYQRGIEFERACRVWARRILVIDDLTERQHDADFLLNQNLGSHADDYNGIVTDGCHLLIGPQYALLKPHFEALRQQSLERRRKQEGVERILVSYGMSDTQSLTLMTLEALKRIGFTGHVDAVIGGGSSSLADVHAIAAAMGSQVRVLSAVEDMATLMSNADLAIGAGGTTSWERCAMGLPAVVVVVADNQTSASDALAQAGAIRVAGDAAIELSQLQKEIRATLIDFESLQLTSARAANICDGGGRMRVLEALHA